MPVVLSPALAPLPLDYDRAFPFAAPAKRRFEEAIGACRDAAAIFRAADDWHGEGQTPDYLGTLYREMRQPGRQPRAGGRRLRL
jgi:hypothetical protein